MIRRDVDGWWWEEGQSYLNQPTEKISQQFGTIDLGSNSKPHLGW